MLAPIIAAVSAALAVAAIIVLVLGLELPQQRVGLRTQLALEVADDGVVEVVPPSPVDPFANAPAAGEAKAKAKAKATGLKDPFDVRGDNDEGSTLHDPFDARGSAPAAKDSATLRIGVVAGRGPATVSIDGRVVGTTPIAAERVTPGTHRIRWEWSDGDTFAQTISIDAGEVRVVKGG